MFGRSRRRKWDVTCRRAVDLMTDYLEGVLEGAQRSHFEAHLAECDACTTYLDQLRAMIAALGMIAVEDVPDDVLSGLVEIYRRSRAS